MIRTTPLRLVIFCLMLASAFSATRAQAGNDFKPIFNGETLDGWETPDMRFWRIQDGAITGQITADRPANRNQFLIWRAGELDDFELKLSFRILGEDDEANSGVQFRSRIGDNGEVIGYQADIDQSGAWLGGLYDEATRRGALAKPGQTVKINEQGQRHVTDQPRDWAVNKDDWNEYHLIARGRQITLKVNGAVTAQVTDNQQSEADLSGVLALQLHAGAPMTVQFKDIRLKRLPLQGRKKIVFLAGERSHGYGQHEHNAGSLLLADALNQYGPQVHAVVYRDGWPADPTALDNADAVCVYCDGGGRHLLNPHWALMNQLTSKGVGLAFLHYALEASGGEGADYLKKWIGGVFEPHWSVNPIWLAEFKTMPDHPIGNGVKPFALQDEWYFHMRFTQDQANVTPILSAVPPMSTMDRPDGSHSGNRAVRDEVAQALPQHLAWAYERADGGRSFGLTGGHFHDSWANHDLRKLTLNALLWIAQTPVPADGVESPTPTRDQLDANQDYPKPRRGWDPSAPRTEPIKALLVTDLTGLYHDYPTQAHLIQKHVPQYANVRFTRFLDMEKWRDPDFADGYDVIVYNICLGQNTDEQLIRNLIAQTRDKGVPAVAVHCTAMSFRKTELWRPFIGVKCMAHDKYRSLTIKKTDAVHPIVKSLPDQWITSGDELYQNLVFPKSPHALLSAFSVESKRDHAVAWTMQQGEGRVFVTTLGHDRKTWDEKPFHQLLANGLLWATDKLDAQGKPKSGYE